MKKIMLVILGLILIGCAIQDNQYHGTGTVKVVVLGDSITVQTEPQLRQVLDPVYMDLIYAQSGYSVQQSLANADFLVTKTPDVVVINLGSNDINQDVPTEDTLMYYQQILDKFAGKCVVLVNLSHHMRDDYGLIDPINAWMQTTGDRVVDWDGIVMADPTLTGGEYDPHPTSNGKVVLANSIKTAVDSCGMSASRMGVLGH